MKKTRAKDRYTWCLRHIMNLNLMPVETRDCSELKHTWNILMPEGKVMRREFSLRIWSDISAAWHFLYTCGDGGRMETCKRRDGYYHSHGNIIETRTWPYEGGEKCSQTWKWCNISRFIIGCTRHYCHNRWHSSALHTLLAATLHPYAHRCDRYNHFY
jgi:hypothetical protein